MFNLTQTEVSDLFAAIDMGWAKPVPAASFFSFDDFGESAKAFTFYRLDKQVFCVVYARRTTVTEYKEVTGEDLEIFNMHFGEG